MDVLEVYNVYSMKRKVAHHFYYKSDLLFSFLKAYNKKSCKEVLMNQFSYVTNNIEVRKIINYIKHISDYVQTTEIHPNYFQISNGAKSVYMHVLETHFIIKCDSIYDAEELLFEPLRLFPSHLFVVHAEKHIYGWISTLRNAHSRKSKQTL